MVIVGADNINSNLCGNTENYQWHPTKQWSIIYFRPRIFLISDNIPDQESTMIMKLDNSSGSGMAAEDQQIPYSQT
jgi:hypothetical protein